MRADAQRSYDQILAVAGDVFVEQGAEASMNEIAKRAGVGQATLYRHFPTREHLYDVLLDDWVGQIQSAADKAVVSEAAPRELLIAWFETLIDHISVHRGGAARLTATLGDETSPMVSKWKALVAANATVLEHLESRKAIRAGTDSIQVCRLVGAVGAVADSAQLSEPERRAMLDIVADALLVRDA